ncbi:MAG: hypothetical protein HUJ26_24475 [Planctomycetaceae bacterium]|nr:hypothetical protein [Planctomycetaceae bacterium]
MKYLGLTFILIAFAGIDAQGQVIQLPIVDVIAVRTAVSVPDRGSANLGGISRADSGSNRYGFSSVGSSIGRQANRSSQRVFVQIHDFEAADRRLLSIAREQNLPRKKFHNPRANRRGDN